ncbi:MAG: hypothetical protein ABII07_02470 [Patescibacteria group bacterium]|nr:hypothetical protein [Patescibacteria group bacterium]
MKQIVKSYAKVNLTLDILGRDPETGYHFIDTVMAEVPDLYDEITIEPSDHLEILTDNDELNEYPEENLAYKAALDAPVKIFIKKNIPLRSGLGGGSSNAAAILKALHPEKAQEIAPRLGMDVPFSVQGGICRCTHFGEVIEPIQTDLQLQFKLDATEGTRSTHGVYQSIDLEKCGRDVAKTEALIRALQEGDLAAVRANIHNDFGKGLTGSGPTKFRIIS